MKQEPLNLLEFQKEFATEEDCQRHLFNMRWSDGFKCPRCGHEHAYFLEARHLYQCANCKYQVSLTAGTVFHRTKTPLIKWFWMIFLIARQKSGISTLAMQKMLDINNYRTAWTMAHKIRKAMTDRDSHYKLAGLVEIDDSYFGKPKSGKRGRGAEGKAKVVVAVQLHEEKPSYATMQQIENVSGQEIHQKLQNRVEENITARTDGWPAYRVFDSAQSRHEPIVVGTGENASKVLPWVHTLIANVKNNIRGVHHGVSSKHLQRYLNEFCYRFNRRFWEPQLFNRLLNACINTFAVSFAELRA